MGNLQDRVIYWRGRATGNWWALARDDAGGYRLVEAAALGRALRELAALPAARWDACPRPATAPHSGRVRHAAAQGWPHVLGLIAP